MTSQWKDVPVHANVGVERQESGQGVSYVAVCTCGWRARTSDEQAAMGSFDAHVTESVPKFKCTCVRCKRTWMSASLPLSIKGPAELCCAFACDSEGGHVQVLIGKRLA